MKEFSQTLFQPERIRRQVDYLAPILRPAVSEESASLLARFDRVVAGETDIGSRLGGSRGGGPPQGFEQPTKPIKAFVVVRAASVNDQLAGKNQGAILSRSGPGGPGGPPGMGGPGGFGPGMFLAQGLMTAIDEDANGGHTGGIRSRIPQVV
jgi:hypothetical protein